jgi:hypothetical protein
MAIWHIFPVLVCCVKKYLSERESERERESFVVACIIFINMKIFVCFIKQACLLATCTRELCGIHMPMHIAELIACIIFLHMKIFVCLIKQACLLAIIFNFFWGGAGGVRIAYYG